MEEELSETGLDRLRHVKKHVDDNQASDRANKTLAISKSTEHTARRYWHSNVDPRWTYQINNIAKHTLPINRTKNTPKYTPIKNTNEIDLSNVNKPKDEIRASPEPSFSVDLTLLKSPITHNVKKTIEILDMDGDRDQRHVVELETSDDDEVIEVALPPKPTITIESSDEEESPTVPQVPAKGIIPPRGKTANLRGASASPVPSTVSSVSDEFIRGDCIALNISSRRPDNHSFDFSLHGSDLIEQTPSSKKKKKRKSKERVTSTPVLAQSTPEKTANNDDQYFATPKSKAKDKRPKKSYSTLEKSIPSADVYDSDSNQSADKETYSVTDKSLPSVDVYESDSSQSECIGNKPLQEKPASTLANKDTDSSDSSISADKSQENQQNHSIPPAHRDNISPALEISDDEVINDSDINESIVIGNVSGFTESNNYEDKTVPQQINNNIPKFCSTKVPAILFEDLDFDNLKGNDRVCHRRKYSITTLRAEMEKFYNESWGGENFNHRELQKSMSRDKSLWVIDPKDRMPTPFKKKATCNFCNRMGHRDDTCRFKPPICYMCGSTGHFEPRCPKKICVNCGSPNHIYSTMCRNCCMWGRIKCAECGQMGHPASHCPDTWRRYHNTIDNNIPLEENRQFKKHYQLYCSGCSRRGHLVNTCRITLPFSGLPINSPYVAVYRPIYAPDLNRSVHENRPTKSVRYFTQDDTVTSGTPPKPENYKRISKSPIVHETHLNKKRNLSSTDEEKQNKNPTNDTNQRKTSVSKETDDETRKESDSIATQTTEPEKALDFIPLFSSNHDEKGQVIQDNEVSDTTDVVTSARVYLTNEIIDKLKQEEGEQWLKEVSEKFNITVDYTDINSFLNIKGKVGDQEAFQSELREWTKDKTNNEQTTNKDLNTSQEVAEEVMNPIIDIPKNRNNVIRKLSKSFEMLKQDLGDPNEMLKELNYLQNHHQKLLNQKVVSPIQLSNNRGHINNMLKKLNMILIGQAGLDNGLYHMNKLLMLQDEISKLRQKTISVGLRQKIGIHYHQIFAAIPRNNYGELIKKYYVSNKNKKGVKINKKGNTFSICPVFKNPKSVSPHQPKTMNIGISSNVNDGKKSNLQAKRRPVENAIKKLVFYHRRLLHARPNDSVLKKTRRELVRKLHSHIASLGNQPTMSSKKFKKMKKIQEQAHLFLNNV